LRASWWRRTSVAPRRGARHRSRCSYASLVRIHISEGWMCMSRLPRGPQPAGGRGRRVTRPRTRRGFDRCCLTLCLR
jgi:hypothetical protein